MRSRTRDGLGATLALLAVTAACLPPVPVTSCRDDQDCPGGHVCVAPQRYCVPASAVACQDDTTCPDGFVCDRIQNRCVEAAPQLCGTVGVFSDAFEGGDPCAPWGYLVVNQGGEPYVREDGGELVFTLDPGVNRDVRDLRCRAYLAADLRGDALEIQLLEGPPATMNAHSTFALHDGAQERLEITAQAAELRFAAYLAGGATQQASIDHDPASPIWLRLREQDQQVWFETSTDRASWTAHLQVAAPGFVAHGYLDLTAWSTSGETQTGQVRYAHLGSARGATGWCPSATLRDDFEAPGLDPRWVEDHHTSGCSATVVNGVLRIQTPSTSRFDCRVVTRGGYRLAESDLWFELASPAPPGTWTGLWLNAPGGPAIDCEFRGDQLSLSAARDPDDLGYFHVEEPAGETRWLRVSQRGGEVRFYRRTAATDAWTLIGTALGMPAFDAAQIHLELGADTDLGGWPTPSLFIEYDNLNLP